MWRPLQAKHVGMEDGHRRQEAFVCELHRVADDVSARRSHLDVKVARTHDVLKQLAGRLKSLQLYNNGVIS